MDWCFRDSVVWGCSRSDDFLRHAHNIYILYFQVSGLSVMPSSKISTVDFFLQDGIILLLEMATSPVALKLKNELEYGSQCRKVWMWESLWWPLWYRFTCNLSGGKQYRKVVKMIYIPILQDMTPCRLVYRYQFFWEFHCLSSQGSLKKNLLDWLPWRWKQ